MNDHFLPPITSTRTIAKDSDAEYVECLDCGANPRIRWTCSEPSAGSTNRSPTRNALHPFDRKNFKRRAQRYPGELKRDGKIQGTPFTDLGTRGQNAVLYSKQSNDAQNILCLETSESVRSSPARAAIADTARRRRWLRGPKGIVQIGGKLPTIQGGTGPRASFASTRKILRSTVALWRVATPFQRCENHSRMARSSARSDITIRQNGHRHLDWKALSLATFFTFFGLFPGPTGPSLPCE